MKLRHGLGVMFALVSVLISVTLATAQQSTATGSVSQPKGPCDIYAAAGTPCVAAHSTTRALYASYKGLLYQVKRQSDGKTFEVGLMDGYADAAAQDAFCSNMLCVINVIYDQSGKGNHLYQAPPGTFKGPAKGAFDTQPIADMAPITIHGRKAYGVYIMPGMGFRNNNASGIAINDQAEGIYYVIDGTHFDSGCCFDYGNSSTNGRAVGTGTMETTYFGTSTVWGRGEGKGPWIMSDMEAGLFSGRNAKLNEADPSIHSWRFVTAVMDGDTGDHWDLRGGDAQKGNLVTFYSGPRPLPGISGGYAPMRKQGGILLGTGGDNGNGSAGTFYEGVMTRGFPTQATTDEVQANIVAAKYDLPSLGLSRVMTFTPKSRHQVLVSFTNTTGGTVRGLQLSLSLPGKGWNSVVSESTASAKIFPEAIPPGASVRAAFLVTSPAKPEAGFLTAKAMWLNAMAPDVISARVRNVYPIKINEVRFGTSLNDSDQFIELYNPTDEPIDVSHWRILHTPGQWATVELASVPSSTRIAPHGFYLLGLSSTGLAAPAIASTKTIYVRTTKGLAAGEAIDIDGEKRTVVGIGQAAHAMTTIFIPVSTGPWLTIPAGSTNLPIANTSGFEAGQRVGIDIGGNYEEVTVKSVGKASTQTVLAGAASSRATDIKVVAASNISVGDMLTVSTGSLKEIVKVSSIGSAQANGDTDIILTSPLRFDHMTGVDVADPGTGITFEPATKFTHMSGDAVQALGTGVTLDRPLSRSHPYGAYIAGIATSSAGYQGSPMPDQWFGTSLSNPTVAQNPAGPFANNAGSLALEDPTGKIVVDALVYGTRQSNSSGNGTITSPELATLEGDQSQGGCIVVAPAMVGGGGTSVGRFPDGADSDSNCIDFASQAATNVAAASEAETSNIKVIGTAGFTAGRTVMIGSGTERETATIANVGTSGATSSTAATTAGSTVIPVLSTAGFTTGQTIMIGSGANTEAAVVRSVGRRGNASITIETPLAHLYEPGTFVAGTGITFTSPLKKGHPIGSPVVSDLPTPGASNTYSSQAP
ncbi:arabinofuranosidase catalytic domain-containing protein [Terriglobus albidus]|uniref:arabinofuranosidase catalytic domain-containing protein n=1 Tax=Terriglobus albidus TaxID=1592106 RepID=UPI0021E07456|nr:arabinofuranosidase catalytic domain-containing protein [Terriglobus albidus]